MNRTPTGQHCDGISANAADVIAMLARVNLSTVIKVLAAMDAVELATDAAAHDLCDFRKTPTAAPMFDGTDAQRVADTASVVARVKESCDVPDDIREHLHFPRFRAPRSAD